MKRDGVATGLMRRLEAHRWIMLAIITAANAKGSLSLRSLIADLEELEKETRDRNEATELIAEFREMARLIRGEVQDESDHPS